MADIDVVNFINSQIHDPRIRQGKEYVDAIQQALSGFDQNLQIEGKMFVAEVLAVLSGPNAPQSNAHGKVSTKISNTADVKEKDNVKDRVRVIARIPHLTAIAKPKKIKGVYGANLLDSIRLSSHPEFVAMDRSSNFDDIRVDSLILVQARTDSLSTSDGLPEGKIISHIRAPKMLESLAEKLKSAKTVFKPECKGNLGITGVSPKFLSVTTEPNPSLQNPVIRKFKTTIKTGIYGNGTPQTKFHFNEALSLSVAQSVHYLVPGPAPNKNNAFIWVGHLRNNGYLDLLDRPIGLGRETIIYAPMTLNIHAPIELKYYFHDVAGFGHAWLHGPDTTTQQSIDNAALGKNDFREKIAPAIKDMIRDKRNFILVIPEMAYSRGFGTLRGGIQRVKDMSLGKKVSPGPPLVNSVLRTGVDPATTPVVKNYLADLPASKFEAYDAGFFDLEDEIPSQNVLQNTHLLERETVTFDGSFAGGSFDNFHSEVREVVGSHLGQTAANNIDNISIVADGLGSISLASILREPLSGVPHPVPETVISRIDFVEAGQDIKNIYRFPEEPSYTIYKDYLLGRIENPVPFEFNYIKEAGTPAGSAFFEKIGATFEFEKGNKGGKAQGSLRFTTKIAPGSTDHVINMHTVPFTENEGSTKWKVGYAFAARSTKATMTQNKLTGNNRLIPDNNSFLNPPIDFVPDHAGAAARSPSEGKIRRYAIRQNELTQKMASFKSVAKLYVPDPDDTFKAGTMFCAKYSTYCVNGTPHFVKLKKPFLEYLKNKEEFYELDTLSKEEKKLIPHLNNIDNLRKILSDPEKGVISKLKNIRENNRSIGKFKELLPNISNIGALEDSLDPTSAYNSLTMHKAAKALRGHWPRLEFDAQMKYIKNEHDGSDINIIFSEIGKEVAFIKLQEQITNQIDILSSQGVTPDPDCPQPLTLDTLQNRIPTAATWNPDKDKLEDAPCVNKDIRVVSNYADLKTMINWDPKSGQAAQQMLPTTTLRFSSQPSGLKNADQRIFQAKDFKYRARARNNTTTYRKSPLIWSCIKDRVATAWEAACNISGYVPFRITSGIKGYSNSSEGPAVAYKTGMSIDAFGLSINIDPPLAGYSSDGDPVYSIFTGMWTPGFVEQHTDELYDLGVLYHSPRGPLGEIGMGALVDAGSRYKDNAYQGWAERNRREAQNWYWAEDSYNGPAGEGPSRIDYDDIMDAAKGSPIVPPGANPVLWVLTFCEKSGMKWGNSFFMRKRFRGVKTGRGLLGYEFRADAPTSWSPDEQIRIATIYDIPDVVARINAISWPGNAVDKHMHFQYYSGSPIIKWEDIK